MKILACVLISLLPRLAISQVGWYAIRDFGAGSVAFSARNDSELDAVRAYNSTQAGYEHSNDGGATWQSKRLNLELPYPIDSSNFESRRIEFENIGFGDPMHGYIAGKFSYVQIVDEGSGWVVGLFMQTADTGGTWSNVVMEASQPYSCVPNGNVCYAGRTGVLALLSGGTDFQEPFATQGLLWSRDSGSTWSASHKTPISTGSSPLVTSIGDSLHIYHSWIPSGHTQEGPWIGLYSESGDTAYKAVDSLIAVAGNTPALKHLFFGHDSLLFADDSQQFWRSQDFGHHWIAIGPVLPSGLTHLWFRGKIGYCSAPHKLLYTFDDGLTWMPVASPVSGDPRYIQIISDSNAYCLVGSTLYKTRTHGLLSGVGRDVSKSHSLIIYPNPAANSIAIDPISADIHIYNILGVEQHATITHGDRTHIDTHVLAPGIYLLCAGEQQGTFAIE